MATRAYLGLALVAWLLPCCSTNNCHERNNCSCEHDGLVLSEDGTRCVEPGEVSSGGSGGTSGSAGSGGDESGGSGGHSGSSSSGNASGTGGEAGESSGGSGGETSSGGSGGSGGATGGSGGTGGEDGSGGSGGTVVTCDGESSPYEDACVVSEDFGVFVSPLGSDDTGDGSRGNPYATLAMAVDDAVGQNKRVYACATEGAFEGPLTLGADEDGVELFGALDCADWSVSEALRTPVAPESGPALVIDGVTNGVSIEGFAFESADATEAGGSSVAGFIQDSDHVVLTRVQLTAGDGAAGDGGTTVAVEFPDRATELDGVAGTTTAGGIMDPVYCTAGGVTRGGAGGSNGPTPGGPGIPDYDGNGGEGGTLGNGCVDGVGRDGADAPASPSGSGASSYGALISGSWTPADGTAGSAGLPGQGGGGGAGAASGGGGSGGAGGCGGAGGAPGQGGGASIALLLSNSPVTLIDSELVTGDGGDGGAGDMGQQGQQVYGFAGSGGPGACQGGAGGLGGDGGAGGGGAGGISVGIVIDGAAPMLENSAITLGSQGDGGVGGDPGNNDGIDGAAEEQLVL